VHYALPGLFTLSKPGIITRRLYPNNTPPPNLPSWGNLVAIETEFVFVQHERSSVIIDDYVLLTDPVVN